MNPTKTACCNSLPLVALFIIGWLLIPLTALAEPGDLIACGGDEVFVIDPDKPQLKKWSWRAEQSPQIPQDFRPRFRSTDDCKPYITQQLKALDENESPANKGPANAGSGLSSPSGGLLSAAPRPNEDSLLLITSSSGGVALIHRGTKECLFLAESKNAHSACLLPNRQIAVASSYGGDQVQFYDRDDRGAPATVLQKVPVQEVPVQEVPLYGAHGTLWDSRRECLWALGEKELLALVADPETTLQERWTVKSRTPLPSDGGHDLSPYHDKTRLFVTTNTQVLMFDRNQFTFAVADGFSDQKKIKSVDRHPMSGRTTFHQATAEHWWSDTIRFTDGEKLILPDERLYKVRWDIPSPTP